MHYSYNKHTENKRKPDFIFPSINAYNDASFDQKRLSMLAVKSSVRERWAQVLKEADRIPSKHLLTVQEGISPAQFDEMMRMGVRLVVPAKLHRSYGERIRPHLISLEGFLGDLRALNT